MITTSQPASQPASQSLNPSISNRIDGFMFDLCLQGVNITRDGVGVGGVTRARLKIIHARDPAEMYRMFEMRLVHDVIHGTLF